MGAPARPLRQADSLTSAPFCPGAAPLSAPLGSRAQANTTRMIAAATVVGFVAAFSWKAWHQGQKKLYDDFYATKK